MSDDLYDVDPNELQEDEQNTSNKLWGYVIIIIGVMVCMFVVFRLMLRLNYKLNAVRTGFRPTMKWILIALVVFVVLIGVIMFLINILGKKGEYDKHYIKEKIQKK